MSWRRILSEAPRVDDRNGVRYHEVPCRTVLNEVRGTLPFDRSLNPYLNCELACAYCYARDFTRRRQARDDAAAFEREIYAKTGAPAALRRELLRLDRRGELARPIALGTATDPYQPLEKRARITRRLLRVLADVGGVRVSLTTKSDLVLRDLDLLTELGRVGYVRVNVTLTTPDRDLARSLEPRAPTPRKRIRAVEGLAAAGVPVGVFCMPILPDVTDGSRELRHLVCAAKEAGAAWFSHRVLALAPGVRPSFFAWLESARPSLVHLYRRLYARSKYAPPDVVTRIDQVADALRKQYRLPASVPYPDTVPPARHGGQLDLFESDPEPTRRLPLADPQDLRATA